MTTVNVTPRNLVSQSTTAVVMQSSTKHEMELNIHVAEYTVFATIHNTGGKLLSGITANVAIKTASVSHTLIVPAISLVNLGSQEGVYVISNSSGSGTGTTGRQKRRAQGNGPVGNATPGAGNGGSGSAGGAGSFGISGGSSSANAPSGTYC